MLMMYLCNINPAANITSVLWMRALKYKIKKTLRMMTRTCSKGMFNGFFGQ